MVDDTTLGGSAISTDGKHGGGLKLILVGPSGLQTVRLPESGPVVIGRDRSCEVRIDDPRISRRHARLDIGPQIRLEDLGSRNGTLVGQAQLRTGMVVTLNLGEGFTIPPFSFLIVRARSGEESPVPSVVSVEDPSDREQSVVLSTIARASITVLVRGETGVGKEVLADTIHRLSGRSGRVLRLNCAAFGGELLESELFGHERGAFTSAVSTKPGLLEVAAGGTVFLDEVGEMPLHLQPKLLRAIEAREVLRVGGTRPVLLDVRYVVATNRDLHQAIANGVFRLDLYHRLSGITLVIPPLRERATRLNALIQELLADAARRAGQPTPRLAHGALARLQSHTWPGNVRELRNTLERAVLLAMNGEIRAEHVLIDAPPPPVATPVPPPQPRSPATTPSGESPAVRPDEDPERQRILDALEACAGNQTRAAKLLGISRSTLTTKLSIHRIPRPRR